MNHRNINKFLPEGFTLIELLVVVAIIGVLASVILVSLNSARAKAKDSRLISDVHQLRTQIESDSSGGNYANTFTPTTNAPGSPAPSAMFKLPSNSNYSTIITDAMANSNMNPTYATGTVTNNGSAVQYTAAIYIITDGSNSAVSTAWNSGQSPTTYSIWTKLSTGNWFCLDSLGNSVNPSTAVTTYPLYSDYKCR